MAHTESSIESAASLASPRRWWVLAVMSLSIFMVFVDGTVVNTALPAISRGLGASTAQLQWVVNAYGLILAGLVLAGGMAGDRFGRKRMLMIGMTVFGAASVGAALSQSIETLILFRAAQGLGAALLMPATLSTITAVFPRGERTMAIGIWTGVGAMGVVAGPSLGGYLVDQISWSAVFWLHLPVVAVALAGMAIVPESRDSRRRPLDIPGAVLATSGLIALVYGLIQGSEAGWASREIIGSFALAAVLLSGFAWVEMRSVAPMLPLRFFKQRDLTGAVVVVAVTFFAMFAVFFFLTLFFQLVQGKSALEAGLMLLPGAFGMMIAAVAAGMLARVVGPKVLIVVSMLGVVVVMLTFTQFDASTSTLVALVWVAAFGIFIGLGEPPLTDTIMAAVPVDDAGIGSALNDVSRELGGALGIAVMGSVVNGVYRSGINDALTGVAPAGVVRTAGDGIGLAKVTAASLPGELGLIVSQASDIAFVDAIGLGALVAAGFMAAAAVVALIFIPRTRREQVELSGEAYEGEGATMNVEERALPAA